MVYRNELPLLDIPEPIDQANIDLEAMPNEFPNNEVEQDELELGVEHDVELEHEVEQEQEEQPLPPHHRPEIYRCRNYCHKYRSGFCVKRIYGS